MYNLGKVLSLSESHLYNFFIDLNEDNDYIILLM